MSLKSLTLQATATLLLAAAATFIAVRSEPSGSSLNGRDPEISDHQSIQESRPIASSLRSNDASQSEIAGNPLPSPAEHNRPERALSRASERPFSDSSSLISWNGERRPKSRTSTFNGSGSSSASSLTESHPDSISADIVHINGLRIEVHGYDTIENGGDLLMSVTPETETSFPNRAGRTGFTVEEERFRAKWGWVAFDQVRRTALASAEGKIR